MNKPARDRWLSLLKETDYALDQSGAMVFLGGLVIGSHLLHSPAYARTVFALVFLLCLMPKTVCGFYGKPARRPPDRSLRPSAVIAKPWMAWPWDSGRLAQGLKAGLRRAWGMAVAGTLALGVMFFGALTLSAAGALLEHAPKPETTTPPRLVGNYFLTGDQARLPMRSWLPEQRPVKAVLVALHGFNDYSAFFEGPGHYFESAGIASYAYDQRGFGRAPGRGSWAGIQVYTRDLSDFVRLIRERHPGLPVYLLGESMGAAELIVALTGRRPPPVAGVILSAPAVGGWESLPWYQRAALWTAAHTVPGWRVTGERLRRIPSDNLEMRRALYRDPLILKETRLGTLYGLAELMSRASARADRLNQSTLILYGERDEIVPKPSIQRMLKAGLRHGQWRIAVYDTGYHLLLRDVEGPRRWRDIAAWIDNPARGLPSGADRQTAAVLGGGPS